MAVSSHGRFTRSEKAPGIDWVGELVGLSAAVDDLQNRKISGPEGSQTIIPIFLVNDQRDAQIFSMCLFLFITLYMFRAYRAHHQERQIVSIQPLVAVILCWWPRCVQVRRRLFQTAHISATNIEWLLPEAVLIQFVSPDDEHDVLETCRELNRASRWSFTKNHYMMYGQQNA